MLLLAASVWAVPFQILLTMLALLLMLVVLVQRGRGGGLTGALGGMGGQSAFGAKAGDTFTRITIVLAACWILVSMAAVKVLSGPRMLPTGPAAIGAPPKGAPTNSAEGTTTPVDGEKTEDGLSSGKTEPAKTEDGDKTPADDKKAEPEPKKEGDQPKAEPSAPPAEPAPKTEKPQEEPPKADESKTPESTDAKK